MPATSQLDITARVSGTTHLLALEGEIDLASVDAARTAVHGALDGDAETVVLDLSGISFLDSCGVHLVQEVAARADDRGIRLVVLPGPPHVQMAFELTGLATELPFARAAGRFAP